MRVVAANVSPSLVLVVDGFLCVIHIILYIFYTVLVLIAFAVVWSVLRVTLDKTSAHAHDVWPTIYCTCACGFVAVHFRDGGVCQFIFFLFIHTFCFLCVCPLSTVLLRVKRRN